MHVLCIVVGGYMLPCQWISSPGNGLLHPHLLLAAVKFDLPRYSNGPCLNRITPIVFESPLLCSNHPCCVRVATIIFESLLLCLNHCPSPVLPVLSLLTLLIIPCPPARLTPPYPPAHLALPPPPPPARFALCPYRLACPHLALAPFHCLVPLLFVLCHPFCALFPFLLLIVSYHHHRRVMAHPCQPSWSLPLGVISLIFIPPRILHWVTLDCPHPFEKGRGGWVASSLVREQWW